MADFRATAVTLVSARTRIEGGAAYRELKVEAPTRSLGTLACTLTLYETLPANLAAYASSYASPGFSLKGGSDDTLEICKQR